MSNRSILSGAAVVLFVGLVVNFPARLAYSWFGTDYVRLAEIKGSVWSGSAGQADFAGIYCTDTRWRISPTRLLFGKLAAELQTSPVSGSLSANVEIGRGGNLRVTELNGQVPLAAFSEVIPLVGVSGRISPRLSEVEVIDGQLRTVTGTVIIEDLVSRSVAADVVLGSFLVELQNSKLGIVGSVEDTEAVLDIAGAITLTPQGAYSFVGQVAENAATPAKLKQQLTMLGEANSRGQRNFRLEGAL